ncbi:MAG: MBL fold metallo-hydrolase [Gemmatimonadota bacterium]
MTQGPQGTGGRGFESGASGGPAGREPGSAAAGASATIPLSGDVRWVNECFPVDGRHLHVSIYLIRAEGGYVVVDSGSFYHRESLSARLRAATAPEGVRALILSHTDYPHSGNVGAFRREWGDIEIVASSGAPEIQGLPYATKSTLGGTLRVAGREFEFLDPPLADRSHTSWIFDRASGILFTADGFGSYHEPDDCRLTSAELPGGIPARAIREYHEEALPWLRYVDPPKLEAKLARMFAEREVRFVAPVHGHPIAAADLPAYLEALAEAAAWISRAYTVP